jgi:hypothetical protein
MEGEIHKAKETDFFLKYRHYKNLIRLIHNEKTTIAGFTETSGHLDTNDPNFIYTYIL